VPDLLYEKRDGVAILTFNRPERRNALSPQLMVLLADAWKDFRDDDSLLVALLTGAGDKAFCAGGDLQRLMPLFTGARQPEDEWDQRLMADPGEIMSTALLRPFELYKPIVAAVNGYALAGGSEILQSTDIRIASRTARFGLSEAKRGLVPGGGSMVRLPRQIPYCKAMEIMLLGDDISAEEAHRIGFINELVEPEALMTRALEVADRLAGNGPIALRKIKEAVLRTSGLPLDEAYAIERECAAVVTASEDAREGPRAFMEKREPVFKGR
jgi:enoyl-CoA hydratase